MEYVVYKSVSAIPLTYRVFLNYSSWVGMEVYEIIAQDFSIQIKLLATCKNQWDNIAVSKLHSQVVWMSKKPNWKKFEDKGVIEKCLNCTTNDCFNCKNYNILWK